MVKFNFLDGIPVADLVCILFLLLAFLLFLIQLVSSVWRKIRGPTYD